MNEVWLREKQKRDCKSFSVHVSGEEEAKDYCKKENHDCYAGCWGEDEDKPKQKGGES